jgi:hypothetical protein
LKRKIAGWLLISLSALTAAFAGWYPFYKYVVSHHISWRVLLVIAASAVALAGFGILVFSYAHSSDSKKSGGGSNDRAIVDQIAYPRPVQEMAKRIKAFLQMAVGIYALGWLGWTFILTNRVGNCVSPSAQSSASHQICYLIPPSVIVFKLIADALAASTVIELTYTLFTPGPDEALDPVLLAVAAALLFQLGETDGFKWQDGAAIIFYSISLAVLFTVRVFLASGEEDDPKLWWRKSPTKLIPGVGGNGSNQR